MQSVSFCPISKLETVLLTADGSENSEGAIREAITFAKMCSSRIYVMTVLDINVEYETATGAEEEAVEYLESIKTRAVREGLECETVLHYSEEPDLTIVDEAEKRKADLIVMGRHGRKGLMRFLMGEVAGKVIGSAPCKVLVVPKAARIEYRKILIATDGSEHSNAAASEAVAIARKSGGSIIALSAIHSDEELDQAVSNVQKVADIARGEGVPVETLTPRGRSYEVIVETAGGRGVDLIVIGPYETTGLKRLLMGSTTERVIGLAGCASLVVKAQS
jgi:nucleotide-binding universal stress UspA family protein